MSFRLDVIVTGVEEIPYYMDICVYRKVNRNMTTKIR